MPFTYVLKNQVDFEKLCELLKLIVGDNFKYVTTTNGVTIYTSSPDEYRLCIKYLKNNNAELYCFQIKEVKSFQVILRGLHLSIDHSTIVTELCSKGQKVCSVANVLFRNKYKLLLFADLEKAENNKIIYTVHSLFCTKINVKPPKPK